VSDVASAPTGSSAPGQVRNRAARPVRPSPVARPAPADPPPVGAVNGQPGPDPEPAPPSPAPTGPSPTSAGTLLAGRYRLCTRVGSDTAAGAEFWRAEDTVLQRDVGVTVLRKLAPEDGAVGGGSDPTGATRAGEMVVPPSGWPVAAWPSWWPTA
jgi:hypothetical protein